MAPEQLQAFCKAFEVGAPIFFAENHEGVLNRNYDLVTDTGHYFVKAVRDRRRSAIPVIAAAERFMAEGGIPAICMRETTDGSYFVEYDGEVYTLYPYIPFVRPLHPAQSELGTMLARLHRRGAEPLPPLLEDTLMREKPRKRVAERLAHYHDKATRGTVSADRLFLPYIERKLELLDALPDVPDMAPTLVHGDYHLRNLLFSEDGSIIGICDWEKAERAPRAYEVARSVQYICFESREAPFRYELNQAIQEGKEFIAAYRAAFSIEDSELRAGFALRLRKLVMSFWIEEGYYDRGDDRANQFIENETRLLHEFTDPGLIDALLG